MLKVVQIGLVKSHVGKNSILKVSLSDIQPQNDNHQPAASSSLLCRDFIT